MVAVAMVVMLQRVVAAVVVMIWRVSAMFDPSYIHIVTPILFGRVLINATCLVVDCID
jgi:hypothetical protein